MSVTFVEKGKRSLGWSGMAVTLYVVLFAASNILTPGRTDSSQSILDIGQAITPGMAAAFCWLAYRKAVDRRLRASWLLFTIALALSALAEAYWGFYDVALQAEPPSPSPADVAWTLYYPLAFAGLMLQAPRSRASFGSLITGLDACLFTLGVSGISWKVLLDPMVQQAADPIQAAIAISYPLGDVMLIFAVVSLVLRLPLDRVPVPVFFLLGSSLANMWADSVYSALSVTDSYATGNLNDSMWVLGYALTALAAISSVRHITAEADGSTSIRVINIDWSRGFRIVIPYLALPAAVLLLYLQYSRSINQGSVQDAYVALFAFGLVALVIFRQFITVAEKDKLSNSLATLSQELEIRVSERTEQLMRRTEELSVLNRVATELSHCPSSTEVVSTGLRMACEATRKKSGLAWMSRQDGRFDLLSSVGLGKELESRMRDFSVPVGVLTAELMAGRPVVASHNDLLVGPGTAGLDKPDQRSIMLVPLLSRSNTLGIFGILSGENTGFAAGEIALAAAIGAQTGVALENVRRYEEAKELADRDPVTGLLNHRAVHERLSEELKRAGRTDGHYALLMMDVDGFKLFNDTYGHPIGDQVLRRVAALMSETAREYDILGRYGGDEFIAILPDTGTEGAVTMAERLRSATDEKPFLAPDGSSVPIHLSFGISAYPQNGRQTQELIGFADSNLYESKQRGGNSITVGDVSVREDIARLGTFGVLDGLVTAVDNKDHYTRQHSDQVTEFSLAIARAMRLSEESQRTLRIAALLHDVGKIGMPDRILRKPGKLDDEETTVVRQHAVLGEMIIKGVPNVNDVVAAVGSHHERFDGHGYPRGLVGQEIPLLGRVLAIADAYSAMITDRPYRKALSVEDAKEELLRVAGTQLDPELVWVFANLEQDPNLEQDESWTISSPGAVCPGK